MSDLLPMLLLVQVSLSPPAVRPETLHALLMCATDDKPLCIREIVESGVNVEADWNGDTPLMSAAKAGATNAIRELIALGADIEAAGPDGTPLAYAAWQGREAAVRLLLELGAKVNPPPDGRSPLLYAASGGPTSVLKLLIEAGADVNWVDSNSVLHVAACQGASDKVKLLIAAGAKVNARNYEGSTPLICAAAKSRSTVSVLLESGADPDVIDNNGDCAWSKASEIEVRHKKSYGVLDVLKAYQAIRCNEKAPVQ
jgi:ankyrin repeat protein